MKPFFWKFVICIIPCLLALIVTGDATYKYQKGDSGGFKLGVDLVGGTILVYEIDTRKNQDAKSDFKPERDINILAESLKKRIDPNDLYNVTIRPAGGEGRIEIILPTGGAHRALRADKKWKAMVEALKTQFLPGMDKKDTDKLEVGRGKTLELAEKIQSIKSEALWGEQLFNTKAGWKRFKQGARNYWAILGNDKNLRQDLEELPQGDVKAFTEFVLDSLQNTLGATTPKTVQNWIKLQAWDETMALAREKWKFLDQPLHKSQDDEEGTNTIIADMKRIPPDNVDQLVTFIVAKGNIIGQAGLALLYPLVGDNIQIEGAPTRAEVRKFIDDHYGVAASEIADSIKTHMADANYGKDQSVEDVQRIKDLVSKVGSLEFRILANGNDDVQGIQDARKVIEDNRFRKEVDEARDRGLPPPGPRDADGKPTRYKIVTAHSAVSWVTYSWVELGPQERRQLNLDNLARTDSQRNSVWYQAANARNLATELITQTNRGPEKMLQGALFYSRECKDRNLPEEERRSKEFEYFVLTRDPEFVSETSETRVPKIDGSYLISAQATQGQDLRPVVSFGFNTDGGELFGNITRKNVSDDTGAENTKLNRHLAIILDGMVMSAPTINSEIRTHGQISGNFTQKEVDQLVNILRAGRLPATLKPQPVSESTIDATLGQDTIDSGVRAIGLSFAAVLIFMIIYYRFAGLVASAALMANLLLTIGFMVAVQATFTLSGLAGIVLTLGMAVDANVLIYERLREERERGASLMQAIRNGYDRALPTIIDTHLSSIFTAIVLYVVGNDNLKGFAISMTVGLIISLFTSLFMTRLMFDFWQSKGWLTKLTMMRLFAKPDIDFMSIRYVMFAITLGLSIVGLGLFIGRIPNDLNIDFRGGTAYGGQLTHGVDVAKLRSLVGDANQAKVLKGVKVDEDPTDPDQRRYFLTYPNGDQQKRSVSFNNVPKGETLAAKIADVTERAERLPEPSVEMLINTTTDKEIEKEQSEGLSRNFVIRTTEKEPELVQACIDQLLREDGKALLKTIQARRSPAQLDNSREVRLVFGAPGAKGVEPEKGGAAANKDAEAGPTDAEAKKPATASPSFVKSLLNRELRRAFLTLQQEKDKAQLKFAFEVNGEGNSDAEGKFAVLKINFGQDLAPEDFGKVDKALQVTLKTFEQRPQPDRLDNFDTAFASGTRFSAMWAIIASWGAMLLYLWFRFGSWTFGLAAVICLIHDLFFTLGAVALCYFVHGTAPGNWALIEDFKIDLPAVAALLTLVGYSCSDTIVVFDRIREVRGKNPDLTPKIINDSVNQTLSRTLLSSLTVWLVVFVLYCIGGPGVHLFAFVMVVGVVVGTYSSIYIASPLLLMFGEGKHEEAAPPGGKLPAPTPEGAAV